MLSARRLIPDRRRSLWWLFRFRTHLNAETAAAVASRDAAIEAQGGTAAAIVTHPWLEPILLENGFEQVNQIVLFEMNSQSVSQPQTNAGWLIRPMVPGDLPRLTDLDAAAFDPLWRNSLEGLASAFNQACYASVAENDSGLIGYQLATGGAFGTHLARLAVQPATRGRGLGRPRDPAHPPGIANPDSPSTQAEPRRAYERLIIVPASAFHAAIGDQRNQGNLRMGVLQSSWQDKNSIQV
jgi:hypothetical protein